MECSNCCWLIWRLSYRLVLNGECHISTLCFSSGFFAPWVFARSIRIWRFCTTLSFFSFFPSIFLSISFFLCFHCFFLSLFSFFLSFYLYFFLSFHCIWCGIATCINSRWGIEQCRIERYRNARYGKAAVRKRGQTAECFERIENSQLNANDTVLMSTT